MTLREYAETRKISFEGARQRRNRAIEKLEEENKDNSIYFYQHHNVFELTEEGILLLDSFAKSKPLIIDLKERADEELEEYKTKVEMLMKEKIELMEKAEQLKDEISRLKDIAHAETIKRLENENKTKYLEDKESQLTKQVTELGSRTVEIETENKMLKDELNRYSKSLFGFYRKK